MPVSHERMACLAAVRGLYTDRNRRGAWWLQWCPFKEVLRCGRPPGKQPGAGTMTICGPTLKFFENPMRVQKPAPRLGQHTREVLPGG